MDCFIAPLGQAPYNTFEKTKGIIYLIANKNWIDPTLKYGHEILIVVKALSFKYAI